MRHATPSATVRIMSWAVILLPKKKSSKVDLPAWDQEVRLLSGRIEGAVEPALSPASVYCDSPDDRGDDDSGNAFHFTVEAAVDEVSCSCVYRMRSPTVSPVGR